jgi:crotonobetainyl-CoA:carnitine CoA-transferase CaiB-like acyl-CoA transferase
LSLGSLEPQFSGHLLETLGLADLKKLAMSQVPDNQARLKAALKRSIAERALSEWQMIFSEQDVCVEPVLTIGEAAEHPQLKARNMVIDVTRDDGVAQRQIGHPIKFSKTSCQSHQATPKSSQT